MKELHEANPYPVLRILQNTFHIHLHFYIQNRKKLVFAVEVKDPAGVIGKGTHERFIVDAEKFQNKANGKFDK